MYTLLPVVVRARGAVCHQRGSPIVPFAIGVVFVVVVVDDVAQVVLACSFETAEGHLCHHCHSVAILL